MTSIRIAFAALLLCFTAHTVAAACQQKRSRDVSFVELAVPAGAPRPASIEEFRFITDETTLAELTARVGPPDAASGTRVSYFIYCFIDGSEVWVASRDKLTIDSVRHAGKQIFKRGKRQK